MNHRNFLVALNVAPLQDQDKAADGPSWFQCIELDAIGVYKRDGGGAEITSPYLARVFLFATVVYVDDTDLLHWTDSPEDKGEELIESV